MQGRTAVEVVVHATPVCSRMPLDPLASPAPSQGLLNRAHVHADLHTHDNLSTCSPRSACASSRTRMPTPMTMCARWTYSCTRMQNDRHLETLCVQSWKESERLEALGLTRCAWPPLSQAPRLLRCLGAERLLTGMTPHPPGQASLDRLLALAFKTCHSQAS